jgi:predicted GIY-YIG superfamily endonuclease
MTQPLPERKAAKALDRNARQTLKATSALLGALTRHEKSTKALYGKARKKNVKIYLDRLPLYALKEVGAGGVRTSLLEKAGVRTIGNILDRGPRRMENIKGIGPHSARTAYQAAKKIQRSAEKKLSVRLDDDVRPKEETKLLHSLMHVREVHVILGGIEREAKEVDRELAVLSKEARPASQLWRRPFLSQARRARVAAAYTTTQNYVQQMHRSGLQAALLEAATKVHKPEKMDDAALWTSYHGEPETLDTLLRSIVGFVPDDAETLPVGAPPERGSGPRDGITTVYRMFDYQNKLLYVGISNRVDMRIEQHRATKEWFWRVDRITTMTYPNRQAALDAEKFAIKTEKPIYNIVHNR